MKAKQKAYINSLSKLSDNVPLKTPYGIRFSLGNICNFKCIYCEQFNKRQFVSKGYGKAELMSLEKFQAAAGQIAEFDEPIRQICFSSRGEVLLNKALPDMIRIIKERKLAKQVKIVTNASLLTRELSDKLIDAGLDVIKISLQGLSAKKYKEVCKADIDFDVFVDQIRYFYEHRVNCKVQIKIIDIALEEGEESLFYEIFGNISDYVFIETCHGDLQKEKGETPHQFDFDIENMKICPLPFYTINIEYNGDITPCCGITSAPVTGKKTIIANIYDDKKLKQIWEEDFMRLQFSLIQEKIYEDQICYGCSKFLAIEKAEDCLDNDKEEIIQRYIDMGFEGE